MCKLRNKPIDFELDFDFGKFSALSLILGPVTKKFPHATAPFYLKFFC